MKRPIRGWVLLAVVVGLLVSLSRVDAAKIGGGGGGGVSGWPSDATLKVVTWATSFVNALGIGNGTDYWALYRDATNGLQFNCVVGGTENACNYLRSLSSSFYYEIQNASKVGIFRVTEAGAITAQTGAQYVSSNLGLEVTESDTNPTCAAGNYTIFADASENALKYCDNGTAYPFVDEATLRKTSDETVTSSVALQNDDTFVFPVAANSTYMFRMFVRYSAVTAADLKYVFTLPASAVGEKYSAHAPVAATTCSNTSTTIVTNDITQTDANVGGAGTGAGAICSLVIEGTVVTAGTSGNVTFQWAQVVSDATATTVHANSWMTYRKVP